MKPAYGVLNVSRAAFEPKDGLKFGPGALNEGGAYSGLFFSDEDKAVAKAEELARAGSAAVVFEMTEVHILKPVPVEIITVRRS